MKKIVIKKDRIVFDDKELITPLKRENVDEILGKAEINVITNKKLNKQRSFSVWQDHGIIGYLSDDLSIYDTFQIKISEGETFDDLIKGTFDGEIYIDKKLYNECNWKEEMIFMQSLKKGCFEMSTFIIDKIDEVPEKFKEPALKTSRIFEINYIKPKIKNEKYNLAKVDGDKLKFLDFNFKLAIINELMYKKKVLYPEFDVYEFVKEYNKRKIDIDEEGYEPIKEVVDWFNNLEIPVALAEDIDEIIIDGGNEIYRQIIPFWDGENEYFDIKDITKDEIEQFINLKNITLMPSKYNANIIKNLKKYGIEVDEL